MKHFSCCKNLPFLFFFVVLCYGFYACNHTNDGAEANRPSVIISISDADIQINFRASEIIDSVQFIVIDTQKYCMVGQIDKAEETGSGFYILDTYASAGVFEFDRTGAFKRKFGNKGIGSANYHYPNDFYLAPDTRKLYVLNTQIGRVNVYDSRTGEFLNSFSGPDILYSKFNRLNKNLWVFGDPGVGRHELLFTDSNLHSRTRRFPHSAHRRNGWINNAFPRLGRSDTVLACLKTTDTIYRLNGEKAHPHVFIDFGEKALTAKKFEQTPPNLRIGSPDKSAAMIKYFAPYMRNVNNYVENKAIIAFTFEYNMRRCQVIYNKITGNKRVFDAGRLQNDVTFQKWFPTLLNTGADGENIIASIPAEDVPQIFEAVSKTGNGIFPTVVRLALEGTKSSASNGLLVKIWFKKNF
jgi:6-bladed beta-propeller